MSVWRVREMGGMIPAVDERLLPDNAAVMAENCFLKSGSIVPVPEFTYLHYLAPSTSFAYRLPASYADAQFLYNSYWMEFDDPDTSVVRAPVIGDTHDRYYFVSPEVPPKYNTRARINAGQPAWLLGVPAPTIAPIVNSTGGSGNIVSRAYLYTYVTEYDEEGPPSPPTVDTDYDTSTWQITCRAPVAGDFGVNRNIKKIRIYRSVQGSDDSTTYYLVTEQPVIAADPAVIIYNDTALDNVVTLNAIIPSTSWAPPPDDLFGFILMPNGFMAGWRGMQYSEIWFSEPFRPHAWPAEYTQVVEYPVVGLGITNQSLVCCTESYPVTMQGTHPSYITVNKLVNHEPCLSRGSIINGPEGVFYASPNGLVLVVPGLAENITKGIISKRNWQQLLEVPRLRAARLGMSYFAYGAIAVGVFQDDTFQDGPLEEQEAFMTEDLTGSMTGVIIDPTSDTVAFSMLKSEFPVDNVYTDPWSGEVLIIMNDTVNTIDLVSFELPKQTARWRSKIWHNSELRNVSAVKVNFDEGSVRNETVMPQATAITNDKGVIRFFADGKMVWERPLDKPSELMRMPSGYKADYYQFEIETKWRIHSVEFATSVKELAAV